MGRKNSVRGIAKNPVDHHNGGRGNGGLYANFNGKVIRGKPTKRKDRHSTIKMVRSKR